MIVFPSETNSSFFYSKIISHVAFSKYLILLNSIYLCIVLTSSIIVEKNVSMIKSGLRTNTLHSGHLNL